MSKEGVDLILKKTKTRPKLTKKCVDHDGPEDDYGTIMHSNVLNKLVATLLLYRGVITVALLLEVSTCGR